MEMRPFQKILNRAQPAKLFARVSMADFAIPLVHDWEDGWGPSPDCVPEHLRYLPFVPFSKNDKLGRACEWTQTREKDRRWQKNRQQQEPEQSPFVIEQVDEEGFHLVDTKAAAKPKWGPGKQDDVTRNSILLTNS